MDTTQESDDSMDSKQGSTHATKSLSAASLQAVRVQALATRISELDHGEAAAALLEERDDIALSALHTLVPSLARDVLEKLPPSRRQRLLAASSPERRRQWAAPEGYAAESLGALMELPIGVFSPEQTVAEATEELRELVKRAFITYVFVVDAGGGLLGVVTMRDLLFSPRESTLGDVMLREPFFLRADERVVDAMRRVLNRHYPVYPVCDAASRLVGLVRGPTLFEAQAIELSAQAGSMVGVEKEERLRTPLWRSLRFRHPWLQLNILTAFLAAGVVALFEDTIDRVVVLAAFLPVLAGQSGNTGSQALAVALRGMTLGDVKPGDERGMVLKEAALGLLNGALVGVTGGIGMYAYATLQGSSDALALAAIVVVAMILSCVASGVAGVITPLALKRLGADPATASTIFLTTATDVISMGALLGLASWLLSGVDSAPPTP
jgi:magnesium transporter